jgi:phytoene desaturase
MFAIFFPGSDEHATALAWDITAHEWPARRAITGHDLPIETQSGTCGM